MAPLQLVSELRILNKDLI